MQIEQTPDKAGASFVEHGPPGYASAPFRFLPRDEIAACASFRDAVCLAWDRRAVRGMTQRTLAELLEIQPSHMSNMLNRQAVDQHGKPRQDLPARYIADFERHVRNRGVTQYLIRLAMLTHMEEVIHAQGTP